VLCRHSRIVTYSGLGTPGLDGHHPRSACAHAPSSCGRPARVPVARRTTRRTTTPRWCERYHERTGRRSRSCRVGRGAGVRVRGSGRFPNRLRRELSNGGNRIRRDCWFRTPKREFTSTPTGCLLLSRERQQRRPRGAETSAQPRRAARAEALAGRSIRPRSASARRCRSSDRAGVSTGGRVASEMDESEKCCAVRRCPTRAWQACRNRRRRRH